MHPNSMKRTKNFSLGSNGVDGSGAFNAKNSYATSWHKLLHCLARFAPNSVRQPNSPKCAQIKRNVKKHQLTVQWGGSGMFIEKNPTRLRGTNFCTSSARFTPSFVRQPNGPESTQIVRNAPKHQFRVQWGWIGRVRYEKF